jgi:hypothetical protein
MDRWDAKAGDWASCHFVLTRAGYLHCFGSMEDVRPLDVVYLAR